MSVEILGVQAMNDGRTVTVETAAGRGTKKSVRGVVVEYTGSAVEGVVVHEGERFDALWSDGSGPLYVVGQKGRIHTNASGAWKAKNLKLPHLMAVWGCGERLYVAGERGTIATGVALDSFEATTIGDAMFSGIHGCDEEHVYVTGDQTVARSTPDGFVEVPIPEGRSAYLSPLVLAADNVLLCARGVGGLYRGSPASGFERIPDIAKPEYYGATVFRGEIFIAAGAQGVLRLNGSELVVAKEGLAAYHISASETHLSAGGLSFRASFDGDAWTVVS